MAISRLSGNPGPLFPHIWSDFPLLQSMTIASYSVTVPQGRVWFHLLYTCPLGSWRQQLRSPFILLLRLNDSVLSAKLVHWKSWQVPELRELWGEARAWQQRTWGGGRKEFLTAVSGYDFCIPAYENKLYFYKADNDQIFGLAHCFHAVVCSNTTRVKIAVGLDCLLL